MPMTLPLRLARNLMQEGAEVRIIIQDAKDGFVMTATSPTASGKLVWGMPFR